MTEKSTTSLHEQNITTSSSASPLFLNSKPLLTGVFTYYRKRQQVLVSLHTNLLQFYYVKKSTSPFSSSQTTSPDLLMSTANADLKLSIDDVAGVTVAKSSSSANQHAYLTIYAYVRRSQSNKKRKRVCLELACSPYTNFNETLKVAYQWEASVRAALQYRMNARCNELQSKNNGEQWMSIAKCDEAYFTKPFLVFVNPRSGSGKAKSIYYERVLPVWAESNTNHKLVLTEHPNFVREYVQKINIEEYRGILVISGDGLVYEVLNGLMDRPDWQQAIKIPFGQIPGGSANALACATAYLCQETYKGISLEKFAAFTAFNMSKSIAAPIDVVTFQMSDGKLCHSFLAFEWAFIADLDLETEKYRYLGNMRFELGAIKNILKLRLYRGRVSFLPADDCLDYQPKNKSIKVTLGGGRTNSAQSQQEDANNNEIPAACSSNSSDSSSFKFKYLPALDTPLPSNWLTIEENFILFLVVYLPLISPDFVGTKDSNFNDGNMHIMYVKEGASKIDVLKILMQAEDASHLKNDLVEYVKVKAFRLEPITSEDGRTETTGTIMVDGENVPYGPIQGEITPGLANVLVNLKN